MVDHLYRRMRRKGYLQREIERMVNQDRNTFAALLLALGEADALITGVTRPYAQSLRQVQRVLDPKEGMTPFGLHVLVGRSHTSFIADTTVTERPSGEQLADIAIHTAQVARRMGHEPRVAFLSYSNFGDPEGTYLERIREGVKVLDRRPGGVDFEYEGEMSPDVALTPAMARVYPFSRLTGPANVLVMPGLQTANISAKLLKELGGDAVIGPILVGMARPVQIASMTASASDLVTLGVLAGSGVVR
jgi:malate dehydrogenase (oxaloacetate-decarboxylating)(NADP+)